MHSTFTLFEQGIRRVAERRPGMPVEQVKLTRLVFFAFKSLEVYFNRLLAEYGLTGPSFAALMMIYSSEDNHLNPCDLSQFLLSSRANITRLLDELETAGWVERRASREDRRRIELSLTPAGVTLIEEVLPRHWERMKLLWADFSPEEIGHTEGLLHKLLTRIDQLEGNGGETGQGA